MTHRILLSISLILICLAVLLFIVPTPGSVRPITISQRQKFDESRYPIADYISAESTDPHEHLKRRSRAEKHNKSRWQVTPNRGGNAFTIGTLSIITNGAWSGLQWDLLH
jgi:hypothetical protein